MKLSKKELFERDKKDAYRVFIAGVDMKRSKEIDKIKPLEERKKEKYPNYSLRELLERERGLFFPDIRKIRIKTLSNFICLFLDLNLWLRDLYPNDRYDTIINRIRDLKVKEIPEYIKEDVNLKDRALYDYLQTLQMILDYSDF